VWQGYTVDDHSGEEFSEKDSFSTSSNLNLAFGRFRLFLRPVDDCRINRKTVFEVLIIFSILNGLFNWILELNSDK
jgi:hypothetical protein